MMIGINDVDARRPHPREVGMPRNERGVGVAVEAGTVIGGDEVSRLLLRTGQGTVDRKTLGEVPPEAQKFARRKILRRKAVEIRNLRPTKQMTTSASLRTIIHPKTRVRRCPNYPRRIIVWKSQIILDV